MLKDLVDPRWTSDNPPASRKHTMGMRVAWSRQYKTGGESSRTTWRAPRRRGRGPESSNRSVQPLRAVTALSSLALRRRSVRTFFSLDLKSRLHRHPKRAMADPNAAEVTDELRTELQLAQHRMLEQRRLSNSNVYVAQQRLWFEQKNEQRNKRGPPSTAVSSLATPQEEGQDQIAGAASSAQQGADYPQPIPTINSSLPKVPKEDIPKDIG